MRYREELQEKPIEWSQDYFFQMGLQNEDQLCQRVAFALYKIFVVSAVEVDDGRALTSHLNLLSALAFENIYGILKQITLHPAMGEYLDMVNNDRARPGSAVQPNENFARELLQLFSLGLARLNPVGTDVVDAAGNPIPAYTEDDVKNVIRALTGWTYPSAPGSSIGRSGHNRPYYFGCMTPRPITTTAPRRSWTGSPWRQASRRAGPRRRNRHALLAFEPRAVPLAPTDPAVSHQQSSPAYVARVSRAFNDNGEGVRGDMRPSCAQSCYAEAMDPPSESAGHLKEPALVVLSLFRPIGAKVGDFPVLSEEATEMGQNILFPLSVFGYFSPNYRVPGVGPVGRNFRC